MNISNIDAFYFSLIRVIDAIYMDEEDLGDILYFIVTLATELTGAKGATIRVLAHGSLDLKVVASYGLSKTYLSSGAIDYGKSVTEIMQGDIIIVNDFDNDPRIQNRPAAEAEGLRSVIGIPFTVSENAYSILRVYFPSRKVPTQEEMDLLSSLGKLSCLAINNAVIGNLRNNSDVFSGERGLPEKKLFPDGH